MSVNRHGWDPNRTFLVKVGSMWLRDSEYHIWTVTELWLFEQGSGRELHAVTLTTPTRAGHARRLSQARVLGTMHEVDAFGRPVRDG